MNVRTAAATLAVFSLISMHSAQATVLFTDNFNAAGNPNTNNLNYNLVGREGGTLGTGGLINYSSNGGNAQVGNATGGINGGNYLLNAFGAISGPNANFNSLTGPVTIGFGVVGNEGTSLGSGPYLSGDSTDWTSLQLSNSSTPQFPFVTGADFGIIFRGNGNFQAFSDGNLLQNDTNIHAEDFNLHQISAVVSGVSGVGSGFTGGGTLITLYADGSATPFASFSSALGQIPAFTNDQIAFGTSGGAIGAVTNLSVTVTPEPGSLCLFGLGALGLLVVARRRCKA